MANTISKNQLYVMQTAFAEKYNKFENEDIHFQIYRMGSIFDENIEFGINWSAIGTVTPEETLRFANSLIEVSKRIDKINSMNLVIDYNMEDDIKTNKQFEEAVTKFIHEYLD